MLSENPLPYSTVLHIGYSEHMLCTGNWGVLRQNFTEEWSFKLHWDLAKFLQESPQLKWPKTQFLNQMLSRLLKGVRKVTFVCMLLKNKTLGEEMSCLSFSMKNIRLQWHDQLWLVKYWAQQFFAFFPLISVLWCNYLKFNMLLQLTLVRLTHSFEWGTGDWNKNLGPEKNKLTSASEV